MANPGAESFFGGLLQGVGQGIMNSEQMQYEKKMRDAQSRQRIFETIANDPTMGWDDKATALEQSISGLLPRDKKGNLIPNPASDAIQKIVDSYRQMGAAARTGAQTGAVPATGVQATSQAQNPIAPPQQSPAIVAPANGSVPALPSMPELQPTPAPPQAAGPSAPPPSLPSIPELHFAPPRTPAEAKAQQDAQTQYQTRMAEFSGQSQIQGQIEAIQQQAAFKTRRSMAEEMGLKPGTPAYVNAVFGQNIDTTKPETLDQSAADLFNKYRSGELTKAQFDDGVENLRSLRAVMEKPPAPTDIRQYTSDYLAAHNLPDTPQNRLIAHAAFTKETKTDPGVIRIEALGQTRGMPVTLSTGETVPMNWNTINRQPLGSITSPAYNPEVQSGITTARQLAPKNVGTQVQSYGTFIRHTGDLYNTISTLNNTDAPLMNEPINWLRTNSGDPRVKVFLAKLDPVRKEFESFLLNNRALYDEDRQEAASIIDENASPAQMLAVLPSLIHTGSARLEEADAAYARATRGRHIPNLVTPEAAAVFKRMKLAPPKVSDSTGTGQIPNTRISANAPAGATHIVPGRDGRNHYTNDAGTVDYGVVP